MGVAWTRSSNLDNLKVHQENHLKGRVSLVSINVKLCLCVGSMDRQMTKWILTKLCRHDPWVPPKVFHKTNTKVVI